MAKGKIHKQATPGMSDAVCRQKHRELLPLTVASKWRIVTCEKCLKKRQVRSTWERLLEWWRGEQ